MVLHFTDSGVFFQFSFYYGKVAENRFNERKLEVIDMLAIIYTFRLANDEVEDYLESEENS